MAARRNLLVFANPISGMGRGLGIGHSVASSAEQAGFNVTCFTSHPQTAPDDILPGHDGIVVAVGGDGTLRSVVDRLLAAGASALPPVVTVPLGTANLVATHLGAHWDEARVGDQVAAAILHGPRRMLDVAEANGKAMLAVGGVGFDAQVVHDLAAHRRGPITYAHYLFPTMRSLAGYCFPPLDVTIDGQTVLTHTPAIVFVGNIAEYGAGFSVTPTARPDDGLLDLCVLPCRSWQELFEVGCICGTGDHTRDERVIYRRGRDIHVTSPQRVPVQIDGDEGGFAPVRFQMLPRQLTFILPA